jgi:hypothetical protein
MLIAKQRNMIFLVKIESKFSELDVNTRVDFDLSLEDHL